ncbi:MAG TPA: transglutaminase-like domain-containing protein, partial [Polyangiaceae bacterium]
TEDAEAAEQGLGYAEEEAVRRTLAPIRSLQTPGGVYMTSIDVTAASSGTFSHVVHVYQPDATGEAIRFELAARTSAGVVDASHTFQSVTLTSRPGEPDQSQQSLPNGNGQKIYAIATSRQGWYRFSFTHGAPSAGRTLNIKAYDIAGNSLKIAWSDPPGTNAQVRVRVNVASGSDAFLKGGAYRNATAAQFAHADSIKVNGALFYRRGFDQGRYSFPLGRLPAGQHTLEFGLSASAGIAKYWFGVDERSFDPAGVKKVWDPVQFLYYGAMHTGDYDAWSDGVAFAQGSQIANGVRPPPVRRGTTFSVAVEHPSLNGANATLRIYPLGSGSEQTWPKSLPPDTDYRGGIFVSGALSTRYREHWRITIPSDVPVGRYVLRAFSPAGTRIGSDVVFYVVHNPYPLLASGAISKPELEAYGYDEDEDGVSLQAPFGTDHDNFRDHFTAFYDGEVAYGYTPRTKISGAFRRTQDEAHFSMLDLAVAAAEGTTSEFESMRRLYRLVSQRIKYNRPDIQDDSSITMLGYTAGLTPDDALVYSKPGTELVGQWTGQCFEYGTVLSGIARSLGVLARPVSSHNWLGGWGNHVFAEVYIPTLPQHGGKSTSGNSSPNSDVSPWYVFDATDPNNTGLNPRQFSVYSEAIAPRAMFGKAALVLQGPPVRPVDAVTNPTNWDPLSFDRVDPSGVLTVSAAYDSGPEFWLTASGVTGWLGYGEKDVYRISKEATGAKAVRVRTLPSGGEYLVPKLCVGSASNVPVLPERCPNAATLYDLPPGESYVVVFNDEEDMPLRYLRGDSVKYVLELEY